MTLYDISIMITAWFILITAVARLNDITREQNSKRWWVRRIGLLSLIVAMSLKIGSYFGISVPYWREIAETLLCWGICLTWLTTPGTPPWWRWIAHRDNADKES